MGSSYRNRIGDGSVEGISVTIIAICVIVFVMQALLPGFTSQYALTVSGLRNGEWWLLLTSMFMHGGIAHIVMNMGSLWSVQRSLGNCMTGRQFILTYMVSGVVGSLAWVASSVAAGDIMSSCVGASGAIFGILGAEGAVLVRTGLDNMAERNAFRSWGTVLAINIVYGFLDPSIALSAHVGGVIAGFIIGLVVTHGQRFQIG